MQLSVHDIGARWPQPAAELRPAAVLDGCGPFIYASAGHGQDGSYLSQLRPAAAPGRFGQSGESLIKAKTRHTVEVKMVSIMSRSNAN